MGGGAPDGELHALAALQSVDVRVTGQLTASRALQGRAEGPDIKLCRPLDLCGGGSEKLHQYKMILSRCVFDTVWY